MSENILKALMQLFSIISEVDTTEGGGVFSSRRKVVELFLYQQLNEELVAEYLKVYDEFMEAQRQSSAKKKGKRISVNSVKVLRICSEINEELAQRQKIVVLIRLIEFINSAVGKAIDEQELEFVSTVSDAFNISKDEFQSCIQFVKNTENEIQESPKILIIDDKQSCSISHIKHICSENITGQIRILNIQSVNMYALRYYGNGELYLNGQVIHNERIYVLTQGSSIRSTKVQPIYYSDIISRFMADTSQDKIIFSLENIEYCFKAGNIGLHKFNLVEQSGHVVGIMGGSGAGKSTLLNVLNGIEKPSAGHIRINGVDIHEQKEEIEGVIGYVPQDDLLMDDLTVFQNLYYAAKLCFADLSNEEIEKRCLDLLADIGLFEAKGLKVGNPLQKVISGGQRKRLNIALELIREPSVLFLDEPTSGLSSRDSENIMDLLKELSLKGKLIFVVIHQPSSDIFKMFDNLIILDVGGYPIYFGNPVDALIYFKTIVRHVNPNESECVQCGNVNPEQIFNIIESKVVDEYGNLTRIRKISPKQWNENYLERIQNNQTNHQNKESTVPKSTLKVPNIIKQIKVFITRDVLSKLTNKQYMTINLLESPVLAFILSYFVKFHSAKSSALSYVFRENENIPIYMFMAVVVALFIGLTVSAEEIIKDQKILKREKFLNLSRGGYLFSKISIMFVLSAIQTISFILVGNWILEIHGMTSDYFLILFSTACFANMLGLNISSAFNSAVTIYILIPFILIPQLLLSGVMVKFDKLHPSIVVYNRVPMIGEIMVTRWAYEALAVNQFIKNKYQKNFYKYEKEKSIANYRQNYWLAELRGKLDRCITNMNKPEKKEELVNDLRLIQNEIADSFLPFQDLGKLNIQEFNNDIAQNAKEYLNSLNTYYKNKYITTTNVLEKVKIKMLGKTDKQRDMFNKMKDAYTNSALEDLVINKNELDRYIVIDGMIVQQMDPVYLDPHPKRSGNIRAHFYAPRKIFLNKFYDTFWVNMIVIWVLSVLLIITLYFNLFKRFLDITEELIGKLIPQKPHGG